MAELSGGGLSDGDQKRKFDDFIREKRQISENKTGEKMLADNASNMPRHDNTARLPKHLKRNNCDLLVQFNK